MHKSSKRYISDCKYLECNVPLLLILIKSQVIVRYCMYNETGAPWLTLEPATVKSVVFDDLITAQRRIDAI